MIEKLISGYQLVTTGCTKTFPRSITSHAENERHAVRCCDDSGSTCISPTPCKLASTYQEAKNVCTSQGLQLCPINENLSDTCCTTGCEIDERTMWLRDIREYSSSSIQQYSGINIVQGDPPKGSNTEQIGGIETEGFDFSSTSTQGKICK